MRNRWLMLISIAVIICGLTAASWATDTVNLVVNGQEIKSDVPPQIIDGRTMVPVRFIAEALGSEIEWDADKKTVFINTKDSKNKDNTDLQTVIKLVGGFGMSIKNVPLLAPDKSVIEGIQENYSEFVSPALLAKWQSDPQNAPGRMTSSPWPECIEITATKKSSESKYQVEGQIIEMTSAEMANGGYAAQRPITLVVEYLGGKWLITSVKIDANQETATVYQNMKYGFSFELPASWQGYSIISDKWEGFAIDTPKTKPAQTGPMLSIRHPQWTAANPRQDIPIMVFTVPQWNGLQQREFHVGAAPVGPKELGRNSQYVFALPARYNFAFPTGYEEVENILENDSLKPMEIN